MHLVRVRVGIRLGVRVIELEQFVHLIRVRVRVRLGVRVRVRAARAPVPGGRAPPHRPPRGRVQPVQAEGRTCEWQAWLGSVSLWFEPSVRHTRPCACVAASTKASFWSRPGEGQG